QADEISHAPDFGQQSGRNLQQKVADEKYPGAEPEDGVREMQVAGHLQRRKADVHPVDVIQHVQDEQKRHQTPRDASARTLLERRSAFRFHGSHELLYLSTGDTTRSTARGRVMSTPGRVRASSRSSC